MLSWKPQPTTPPLGFDMGAFELLLCHLLASEREASSEAFSQIASAGNLAGNHLSKTTLKTRLEDSADANHNANHNSAASHHRVNFYADITLSTWLNIVEERSHRPAAAVMVALHNLVELTNTNSSAQ